MPTRRAAVKMLALLAAAYAAAPVVSGCAPRSSPGGVAGGPVGTRVVLPTVDGERDPGDPEGRAEVVRALQGFAADLHRRLATEPGNVVCSPYSVAVALAMTRNGARGRTAEEMDRVLHAPALEELNGGLNDLTRLVESRAGRHTRPNGSTGDVAMDVANSLWGQGGMPWLPAFIDALARDYGAGLGEVDFIGSTEAARLVINDWVAEQTQDRIAELLVPGVLTELTRFVLVNAIFLKAAWDVPFPTWATRPRPFTRPDGRIVQVDTMSVDLPAAVLVQGQGWEAVRLPYAGAQLAMTIVVPDVGGLPALEASLDGPWVGRLLAQTPLGAPLTVRLPRWTFRTAVSLNAVLAQMGMPSAFSESAADFSAMTGERDLVISEVAHQAFVAVDEEGTEAAAATAVVAEAEAVSAPAIPERVLAVDRPFLFVIHDVHTAAPLFLGRVEHPNAT